MTIPLTHDAGDARPEEAAGRARRRGLSRYVAKRVLQAVPTILLIVLATFTLLRLAPGDVVQVLAGESGGGDPAYLDSLRRAYGLDQPLPVQLLHYMAEVARFNLGHSFRYHLPVAELIGAALPATLLLMAGGLALAVALGVAGGAVAVHCRGRWPDRLISGAALLVYASPVFLLGLGLIVLFAITLPWLPVGGFVDPEAAAVGGWRAVASVGRHLVLPAATLGLLYGAVYTRLTRSAMLEVAGEDHVLAARARGLPARRVTVRHVLRNALLPVVTIVGMNIGAMVGGAVLVETIFAWPGIGRLAVQAVFQRDTNLLNGVILCSGTLVVACNLLVDLLYTVLDPRVAMK